MMAAKSKRKATNLCGLRVKLARVEIGMNQLELATALNVDHGLDVDQNSISRLEKGNRFVKDFELVAMADVLGKHPMWLLFGDKIPGKYK